MTDLSIKKIRNMVAAHNDGVYLFSARSNIIEIIEFLLNYADNEREVLHEEFHYRKDRMEKGYYEQEEILKQKYAMLEKQNAHLLKLIMERNNLDPMPKPLPIYPVQDKDNLYDISYKYKEAMLHEFAPEILEGVAKAIWNYEHDNRKNEVLDMEWSLLRSDYLCRAQVALTAYNDIVGR